MPLDHRLRNNLAWLLAGRVEAPPHDLIRAVKLAKEAITLAQDTGADWNTLGVTHYRAGDWKAAAAAIEESMRLRSGSYASDWLFLAMARSRLGNPAAAQHWYNRSLAGIKVNAPRDADLLRFRNEAARLLGPESPPLGKTGKSITVSK